jgi:membrane associated rhomboid family serine protease
MNLTVQLLLGIVLELYHGWWRVTLIYVAGGIAGSLIHPIFNVTTGVIGASGGVFALATAHMATVIMVRRKI